MKSLSDEQFIKLLTTVQQPIKKTTSEKVKEFLVAVFAALSLFIGWVYYDSVTQYRDEVRELRGDVQMLETYEATLQNKVSEYTGSPEKVVNVKQCVNEVRTLALAKINNKETRTDKF